MADQACPAVSEPVPVKVTRYRCPHCPRTASSKARMRDHIARCWRNPAAKGCKTCKHFVVAAGDWGDDCGVGVDLSGRPPCGACHGVGETFNAGSLGVSECTECGGDGTEVKPGPIVDCDQWEAR